MAEPTVPLPPTPPQPAPSSGGGGGGGGDYPVVVDFDRADEVANWRPLVNWLLVIPHLVIVYFLDIIERALAFLSFVLVLFTRRIPDSIFDFRVMVYRYQWRVVTYLCFMRDEYPPFAFDMIATDDGVDPARLSIVRPGEMDRWKPLYKWILAIPHYIVLIGLAVASVFALIGAFFVVLFTGKFPRSIRDFVVGTMRWATRVNAYVLFMTDEYPPFSLT